MQWLMLLGIGVGGAFGSMLRYLILQNSALLFSERYVTWGVMSVNVVGSFLIGALTVYFSHRGLLSSVLSKSLIIGLLGGFTTFSSFSWDNYQYFLEAQWIKLALNILLNVALCLMATAGAAFLMTRYLNE